MTARLEKAPQPRRSLRDIKGMVLGLKEQYRPYEIQRSPEGQPWTGYDRFVGFVGDTEKYKGLLRRWSATGEHQVAERESLRGQMGHHLADYMFSVLAVASDHRIDLRLISLLGDKPSDPVREGIEDFPLDFDASLPDITARARRIIPEGQEERLFDEFLGAAAKDVMGLAGKRQRENPEDRLRSSLKGTLLTTLVMADSYGIDLEQAILQMTAEKSAEIRKDMEQS